MRLEAHASNNNATYRLLPATSKCKIKITDIDTVPKPSFVLVDPLLKIRAKKTLDPCYLKCSLFAGCIRPKKSSQQVLPLKHELS